MKITEYIKNKVHLIKWIEAINGNRYDVDGFIDEESLFTSYSGFIHSDNVVWIEIDKDYETFLSIKDKIIDKRCDLILKDVVNIYHFNSDKIAWDLGDDVYPYEDHKYQYYVMKNGDIISRGMIDEVIAEVIKEGDDIKVTNDWIIHYKLNRYCIEEGVNNIKMPAYDLIRG